MIPGLFLLLISLWSGGSLAWTVWHEYSHQGGGWDARVTKGFAEAWKLRPQTFIFAGFTFVVAVQLISLGLLAAQAKRYFEEPRSHRYQVADAISAAAVSRTH